MSQPPDNERYAREPSLLIDLCREVIDRLCAANDDPQTAPRPRTRRSRLPRTDKSVLRRLIIEALQHFGGSAKKTEVLRFMQQQLEGKLLPGDVEFLPDGRRVVWKYSTDWQSTFLRKDGILKDDSPRGVWELSETPR